MKLSKFLWVAFFILLKCTSGISQSKTDKRPNILLILADDLGYSDLSCYGGEINTPVIDKLAQGGIKFTNFYNAARCCPTRASLLTGLYPHQAGIGEMVYRNDGPGYYGFLNENTITLAEVLKSAGYQTMMSGKWHVGHEKGQWPEDRGFQEFYGIHKHVDSYYKVLKGCDVYYNGKIIQKADEPPVVMRYADILLSRAEALNEISGPTQEAITLINLVRTRANIPNLQLVNFPAKDALRAAILMERGHEFFYEELRRRDLIRHGKFIESARSRGVNAEDFRQLFPFPISAINSNPLLKQNPGY